MRVCWGRVGRDRAWALALPPPAGQGWRRSHAGPGPRSGKSGRHGATREKVRVRGVTSYWGNRSHPPPPLPIVGPCKPARLEDWGCPRFEAHSKAVQCHSPLGKGGTRSTAPPGCSPQPCRYRTQTTQRSHTMETDLPTPAPTPHTAVKIPTK